MKDPIPSPHKFSCPVTGDDVLIGEKCYYCDDDKAYYSVDGWLFINKEPKEEIGRYGTPIEIPICDFEVELSNRVQYLNSCRAYFNVEPIIEYIAIIFRNYKEGTEHICKDSALRYIDSKISEIE